MLRRVDSTAALSDLDLRALAELELAAFESDDLQEGLDAFAKKRKPRFTGS